MNKLLSCVMIVTIMVGASFEQAPKSPTSSATSKPRTSFTDRLLKFLGISDSPGTLKGPGDEVTRGQLWIADLDAKKTRALTLGAGYRSPIFLAASNDVLALRGTSIVRVSVGGEARTLYSVDDILKLVGANEEESGTVLILLRGEGGGHPRVGLLAVGTGAVSPLPYDAASTHDRQMVEDLEGWSRTYGDRHVYVQRQSKQALSGTVEWSDVFLQQANQTPMDVSQCDGVNCGQPSLSADGRSLVFIRASAE